MADPTITCPECKREIRLTESLAAPLLEATRRQFQSQIAQKDQEYAERETALRLSIASDEAQKARRALATELEQKQRGLTELQDLLRHNNEKLAEAQKVQADFLRQKRELDDARREIDLTIERRVTESLGQVREQARREIEESLGLSLVEKDQVIEGLRQKIDDLQKRATQGSQQLQGEAQEIQLEELLRDRFPDDLIEAVPRGEFGGDIVHRVLNAAGQPCGTILWESKRTKNWSDGWLTKLREDLRSADAEIAVIVSQRLPRGVETFDHVDGIWVTSPRCALPVAVALRYSLVEVATMRQAQDGQQTKMEMVYTYLTSSRFRHRVQAIVEKFTDMQEDLEKERRTMTRLWEKRQAQIRAVIDATAGMYGDLQGIAGRTLLEIDGLELKALARD
jgi:hypothetical protein